MFSVNLLKNQTPAVISLILSACVYSYETGIIPIAVSDEVARDSDDPAIWIDPVVSGNSLILGADKHDDGGLFVFDLSGNEVQGKTVHGLKTPNNVDVEYGLDPAGYNYDIAVVTERGRQQLRVYSLPDMIPVDNGGIPMFAGESDRNCMGIGLYKRPGDNVIFAVVSRSDGPSGSYLWQYRLNVDGAGIVSAVHVRSFGLFSDRAQIESVAVDDELGFIYYSDELYGVRKYYADPDNPEADTQLALIGHWDFSRESEGISIYDLGDGTGYIVISDQKANRFNVYPREGTEADVHDHPLVKRVYVAAEDSDGNEIASTLLLPDYPGGLVVAMSTDRTFHYYAWDQFANAAGLILDSLSN